MHGEKPLTQISFFYTTITTNMSTSQQQVMTSMPASGANTINWMKVLEVLLESDVDDTDSMAEAKSKGKRWCKKVVCDEEKHKAEEEEHKHQEVAEAKKHREAEEAEHKQKKQSRGRRPLW